MEGAPDGLDPVRIQKGMFLFAMQADVPTREKYEFEPYDYGPMSAGIYRDLDTLVRDGLVSRIDVKNWSRFRATPTGVKAGEAALTKAEAEGRYDAATMLHAIKRRVAGLPFNELLEGVYEEFPEYATRSVFRSSA